MVKKESVIATAIFFGVSSLLAILWLRPGLMIAAGESGIPFYNLSAVAKFVVNSWSDVLLGSPASYGVGNFYFFQFLAYLQSFSVPGYLIQVLLFFAVTFISQLSIYAICRKIFPRIGVQYHITSSFFYLFNLAAIVGVWNRIQYPFIIAYALFPLALLLYIKGIEERKFVYAFLINGVILLGLIAFTSIPMLELLWLIFLLYSLFYSLMFYKQRKKILFAFNFLIITTAVWFLFNFWWLLQLYQTLTASSYTLLSAYGLSGNIDTFKTLSSHLGNLAFVLRMMHKDFFLDIGPIWNYAYQNPIVNLVTFLVPVLAFFPLIIKKKQKYVYFFLGMSLVIIFLAKGSSGPFGEVFLFFFSHFRFLEAFRNPFEKFSLLLPLVYAPLIGYSLHMVVKFVKEKKGQFAAQGIFIVIVGSIIGISFPIFNRWIFTGIFEPTNNKEIGYYVDVPSNYKDANNWLNLDKDTYRAVALPINGEGITYAWDYGYSGVESSNALFDKSFISFSPTTQYLGNIVPQLNYSLFKRPEDFSKILSILNAKYILVRSDINFKERGMEDPMVIDSYLSTSAGTLLPNIVPAKNFGTLKFYINNETLPVIYAADAYDIAPSKVSFSDVMPLTNFKNGDVILNSDPGMPIDKFVEKSSSMLVSPNSVITLNSTSFPNITIDDARKQLFYPNTLPNSQLYPLIRLKENVEAYFDVDPMSQFFKSLLLSNKRLGEFVAEVRANSLPHSQKSYEEYLKSLEVLNIYTNTSMLKDNIYYFRRTIIAERIILEDLLKSSPPELKGLVQDSLKSLAEFSLRNSVEPIYKPLKASEQGATVVYDFSVPATGAYEILLKDEGSEFNLSESSLQIQIDGSLQNANITKNGMWISLGTITVNRGRHQIQIPIRNESNLISSSPNSTITISSENTAPAIVNIPTKPLEPSGTYQLTFDYWFQKGNTAQVGLGSNLEDPMILSSYKNFGPDGYNNDFQTRSYEFSTNPEGHTYAINFKIFPYNDCSLVNSDNFFAKSRCTSDKKYHDQFSKQTSLQIKNLRLKKIFTTSQALLKLESSSPSVSQKPTIKFVKNNQSEYTVSVINANSPYFLVLSQSFHPLWTAQFSDTKEEIKTHNLVNSYANAWYINRPGTYTVKIVFSAEKYLFIGKIVSFTSIIISILFFTVILIRKKYV